MRSKFRATPTRCLLEVRAVFGQTCPAASTSWPQRTLMRIESKAPTRVDLAGGTLDIWPLYLFHPGAVTVNAAITRYASCRIETHAQGDERIRLISRDTQREEAFASFADLV